MRNAAASPGRASRGHVSTMPMPQRSQTRRRSSGRPGGSSEGCPQREQKRIGCCRPRPGAGVHARSIRMSAVTRSDHNTEPTAPPAGHRECSGSEAKRGPNFHPWAAGGHADSGRRPHPGGDSLSGASYEGERLAVRQELWGPETIKAVENFPVSGERVPTPVVRWLGRINANEVIASLAGEDVHPNDHVNMGQSSNDVFPSAVHLAAVDGVQSELLPALERLAGALRRKAEEFADIVKSGRTHMMDAVPVTLGQEFAGYAAQMTLGRDRVREALGRASQIPLGGTATGTGLNTHPEFAERVREQLSLGEVPRDRFEAQANRDGLVELHAALKGVAVSLTKIANDLVLMGSGPRTGLREIQLPELQKGSSIMPGKVNPVIPEVVLQVAAQVIGNDTAVTVAGSQGAFELNVRVPMMARNVFESIRILTSACHLLATRCVEGIQANEDVLRRHAESTPAIATALNPYIGYDKATEIVTEAVASERTIREVAIDKGVDEETLDKALDLRAMARGTRP